MGTGVHCRGGVPLGWRTREAPVGKGAALSRVSEDWHFQGGAPMDGKLRRATWIMVILAVAVLGGGAASSSAPASLGDDQMRAVRGTAVNCWQCLHKACPNGHPEECARRQFAGVMYCN